MKELMYEWKKFLSTSVIKEVKPKGNYSYSYTENAVNFIKKHEGFKKSPYQNPGDKPTIGYGTTVFISNDGKKRVNVKLNNKLSITEKQADSYLRNYLNHVVMPSLNAYLKHTTLNPNQVDAIVSLMYNKGNSRFLNSPIFTALNKNPNDPAIKQLILNDAVGKPPGIMKRRQEEASLYFLEGYEDSASKESKPLPAPQSSI